MRIWHLTKIVSGGAGQYALRLSEALRADGHESDVLLAESPTVSGTMLLRRIDGRAHRLAAQAVRSIVQRVALKPFHSIRGLEFYEAPHRIQPGDIVHLHGMTGWIGVAGLTDLIPLGARVFITAHAVWAFTGGCCLEGGRQCDQYIVGCGNCPILRRPWRHLALDEVRTKRALFERFRIQPIANSTWTADRMRESLLFRAAPQIPVVYPIVDEVYFANSIVDMRAELNIAPTRTVISLGARAVTDAGKGIHDFLCELAAARVLAARLTILIFGDGTIDPPRNLDVRMLGSIASATSLARIYATSTVFVSPSKMETFGMTLAEAQAVGVPVVAFDVGGIRDAVHPDWHRFLVAGEEISLLVASLSRVLVEREEPCSPSVILRAWARQRFSARAVASVQRAVYNLAASESSTDALHNPSASSQKCLPTAQI